MTRMPDSFSRKTWFSLSTWVCCFLNQGWDRFVVNTTTTAMTGTTNSRIEDSFTSCLRHMTMPPMSRIGVVIMVRSSICMVCWSWFTSLVVRVMREGVPKRSRSDWEKAWTLVNRASRISRP